MKTLDKHGPYLIKTIGEVLEKTKNDLQGNYSLLQKELFLFKMLDSLNPLIDTIRCLSVRNQLISVAEKISDEQKLANEDMRALSEYSDEFVYDENYPCNFNGVISQVREDFVKDLTNSKARHLINSEDLNNKLLLNKRLGLDGYVYKQSLNEIFGNAFKRPFQDSKDQVNLYDKWRSLPSFYIYSPLEIEIMYKKPLKWSWINDIPGSSNKNLMVEYFDGQIVTLFEIDLESLLENNKWFYFRSFYLGTEWIILA